MPMYKATKPIDIKTTPINKVFATTAIAKGVKIHSLNKNVLTTIKKSEIDEKVVISRPRYPANLNGHKEKLVMLDTAKWISLEAEKLEVPLCRESAQK